MSKVICEREQLVSIADAIRVQNGETSEMTLDEMSTAMDENNAEIEEISGLIEEISEILDGKAAAGGGSLEMSHVALSVDTYDFTVGYTTVDENGSLKGESMYISDGYVEFEAVKGSAVAVKSNIYSSLVVEATGCELIQSSTAFAVLSITDDEAVIAIEPGTNSSGGSND